MYVDRCRIEGPNSLKIQCKKESRIRKGSFVRTKLGKGLVKRRFAERTEVLLPWGQAVFQNEALQDDIEEESDKRKRKVLRTLEDLDVSEMSKLTRPLRGRMARGSTKSQDVPLVFKSTHLKSIPYGIPLILSSISSLPDRSIAMTEDAAMLR